MRFRNLIKWVLTAIPFAVLLLVVMAYMEADTPPAGYAPATLTAAQRDAVAEEFINEKIFVDFHNAAQQGQPFDWSLSQDRANAALASMDEIAYRLGSAPQTVTKAMEKMKLADPAVTFNEGELTLMAKSLELNRVVSVSLSFESDSQGRLAVRLARTRVGRLPIPQSMIRGSLESLRAALPAPVAVAKHKGSLKAEDLAMLFGMVAAAMDGKGVEAEIRWPRPLHVEKIQSDSRRLTLRLVPLPVKGE